MSWKCLDGWKDIPSWQHAYAKKNERLSTSGNTGTASKKLSIECFKASELYSPPSKLSYIVLKFPGGRDLQVIRDEAMNNYYDVLSRG